MTIDDQDDTAAFTERAITSLVTEIADLQENVRRLGVVTAALASAYGVPAAIEPVSAIVK